MRRPAFVLVTLIDSLAGYTGPGSSCGADLYGHGQYKAQPHNIFALNHAHYSSCTCSQRSREVSALTPQARSYRHKAQLTEFIRKTRRRKQQANQPFNSLIYPSIRNL